MMKVSREGQGLGQDGDVEELNGTPAWVVPAVFPRKTGLSREASPRESNNPMTRMRRVVATASAIL